MAVASVRALSSLSYLNVVNVVLTGECFCCCSSSRSTAIVQLFSIALGDIVSTLACAVADHVRIEAIDGA